MLNYNKLNNDELTNKDLKKILGKDIKIIAYPELAKVNNIGDIFDKKGRLILFWETEAKNIGHWACMFKTPQNHIFYFDPYGLKIDATKKYINTQILQKLKEIPNYLTELLLKYNDGHIYYNSFDYQSWKSDVSTCGKFCSVRLLHKDLNSDEFYDFLNDYKKSNKLKSFDDCVSKILYPIIRK
jgi:hypothetical protein